MKVLHVVPSLDRRYGGPTRALMGYVNAAQLFGAEVSVAAPAPPANEIASVQASTTATTHLFRSSGKNAGTASVELWQWLRRSAGEYDVVHVHGLFNPVSSLAARIAVGRTPTVLRPFGTLSRYTFEHRRSGIKRAYFRLIEVPTLRRLAAIHFTSEAERAEAGRFAVVRDRAGFVIPPPIAIRAAASVSSPERGSAEVLFVGRLDPVKNLPLLIDAWKIVRAANPAARLEIAGSGSEAYAGELHGKVAAAGLADCVSFAGFADAGRKDALFRAATAFVLPSRHENFGVVVLEAISHGLPCVITPEVALSSFVGHHRLGIVAEPSPNRLAEAILQVLRDRELQAHCRHEGPRIAGAEFSPQAIAGPLRKMYEHAVQFGRKGSALPD